MDGIVADGAAAASSFVTGTEVQLEIRPERSVLSYSRASGGPAAQALPELHHRRGSAAASAFSDLLHWSCCGEYELLGLLWRHGC